MAKRPLDGDPVREEGAKHPRVTTDEVTPQDDVLVEEEELCAEAVPEDHIAIELERMDSSEVMPMLGVSEDHGDDDADARDESAPIHQYLADDPQTAEEVECDIEDKALDAEESPAAEEAEEHPADQGTLAEAAPENEQSSPEGLLADLQPEPVIPVINRLSGLSRQDSTFAIARINSAADVNRRPTDQEFEDADDKVLELDDSAEEWAGEGYSWAGHPDGGDAPEGAGFEQDDGFGSSDLDEDYDDNDGTFSVRGADCNCGWCADSPDQVANRSGSSGSEDEEFESEDDNEESQVAGQDTRLLQGPPGSMTGLLYNKQMTGHCDASPHPERPARISCIYRGLVQQGLADQCVRISCRHASVDVSWS